LTISGEIDESADLIILTVTDTGCGIELHDLPRIFEPFYSTKTDGRGSGLGLAMVYGIIHEHHGSVEVESEPGKGSTFRIKLPRNPVSCKEDGYPQDKVPTAFKQEQSQAGESSSFGEGGGGSV